MGLSVFCPLEPLSSGFCPLEPLSSEMFRSRRRTKNRAMGLSVFCPLTPLSSGSRWLSEGQRVEDV
ncbi:MAG: hypothetical protein LBD06_08675, partial [Candidatus Accumulibacter sp.]|nr:hypothetical protein [Accumulibacter sp.]